MNKYIIALAVILVGDGGGLVEVMRRGWIQLKDVDIFCFMFRASQFNPHKRA